jgi:hypothetical protein
MPSLLLFGAIGMGKTRIVQKFLRDNRSSFDEITGTTRVPVAAIQMPPTPWERDFYEELFDRTRHRLAGRHEFHSAAPSIPHRSPAVESTDADHRRDHSMLAGTFREQRIFLNSIRFLANDLSLPLACVGTHEAKQALMTDQQLADRFEACELPAWQDDAAFAQLLASFASVLPLRRPSELRDPKLQKRIFSLTEGVMVRVCRLLEEAALRGIETSRERIDMESITTT